MTHRYERDQSGEQSGDQSRAAITCRYEWDSEDRLVAVATVDGRHWRYRYDAFGRRIAKQLLSAGGVSEQVDFVWDGVVLVEQTDHQAVRTWEWEPGTFRPISQVQRQRVTAVNPEPTDEHFYAIVTDPVGTPVELVTPDGQVAWRLDTTLWGTALSQPTGNPDCPLRFVSIHLRPERGGELDVGRAS